MTLRPITSFLAALTMVGAVACQSNNANQTEDEAPTQTNSTKADEPKAVEKPVMKTFAVENVIDRTVCVEFAGPDRSKFMPNMPEDTDTKQMLVVFRSREDVAKVFGACTAPPTDAFDFAAASLVYKRDATCNLYDEFTGLELEGDALRIKAINNLKEVACLNLGHFWFETPVLGPDVVVTVESTDPM